MLEIQLQIYLIAIIGGALIAGLILANGLLIYYLVKLSGKVSYQERLNQESSQNQAFDNSGLNLEEELNRRYTQYTPEPEAKPEKKSKGSLKSPNTNVRSSVIDVSEEFDVNMTWNKSQTNENGTSQFNSNIVLQTDKSFMDHNEGRTSFIDRDFH